MHLLFKGKNIRLTPALRRLAEQKLSKLDRYHPGIDLAEVEMSVDHTKSPVDRFIVDVTMQVDGTIVKCRERAGDMRVALDTAAGKLYQQLQRAKEKARSTIRGRTTTERFVDALAGPTGGEYGLVLPPRYERVDYLLGGRRSRRRHPGGGHGGGH